MFDTIEESLGKYADLLPLEEDTALLDYQTAVDLAVLDRIEEQLASDQFALQ